MKQDFYKDIANYLNRLQETIAKLNHDEINTFINLLIAARDEEKQILSWATAAALLRLLIFAAISIKAAVMVLTNVLSLFA